MLAGSAIRSVEARLLVVAKIGCLAQKLIVKSNAKRATGNPPTGSDREQTSLPEAFREMQTPKETMARNTKSLASIQLAKMSGTYEKQVLFRPPAMLFQVSSLVYSRPV